MLATTAATAPMWSKRGNNSYNRDRSVHEFAHSPASVSTIE